MVYYWVICDKCLAQLLIYSAIKISCTLYGFDFILLYYYERK
jgi:hypothetical protein